MIIVQKLEDSDVIEGNEFIRPLNSIEEHRLCKTSPYSGTPCDHFKWCQIKYILGPIWKGKTLQELNEKSTVRYEVIRGNIPNYEIENVEKDIKEFHNMMWENC